MKDMKDMKDMNGRRTRRNTMKSGLKRTLSGIIAFTFVLNLSPSAEIGDWLRKGIELTASAANKDTVPEGTVYSDEQARVNTYYDSDAGYYLLNDVGRVLDYSRAYYSYPEDHQDDVICINFGQGDSSSAINNFLAIGTEECPFNGTIKLTTSSTNTLNIPEAFFDYVYDSATIISETTSQPSPLILTRTMDGSGEPVLARHVKHNNNGDAKTWQIQLDAYNSTYNYSVGGFIGEMEDDAQIILDITDNTTCDIYGTDDIGYVCGKMGEDTSLTVNSIAGSNSSYDISTTDGNAGGVVGSMEEDADLILNCAMPNSGASVAAAGTGNYAGGIVGYNDGGSVEIGADSNENAIFSSASKYQILNTISGVAGSGGVFGYYRPTFTIDETTDEYNPYVFDISWLQIGTGTSTRMTANGKGTVGGLFGMLVNEIKTTENGTTTYSSGTIEVKDNSDNSATIYLDHDDTNNVSNYGGLIGTYTACNLSGALNVTDVSVNVDKSGGSYDNFGGAIGITEGGNGNDTLDSLYVKFDDYNVTVASGNGISTSVYGGLVARSTNAFIDANNITCNSTDNFYGGGVIGRMDDGVLRLSGTTDLTGGYAQISNAYYYEGQIVGGRDNSLIFAEYDSENSRQWVLKRSTACSVDDIGSWGEVLRFTGISTTETNDVITSTAEKYGSDTVLTIDELTHKVTVSAPTTQTTIGSIADYAMISLRFQLTATDGLPVVFNSSWSYTDETIITQDLTLGATFSLAGTGLTGLTRDNAETASDSAAYCVYKGKFDGGNKTLTLATGEAYGQRGTTALTDHTAQGNGKIYRHIYTGLFGIVDGDYDDTANYTVKDLTLSGTVDVSAQIDTFYCGGFAARAIQDFTATNVKTEAGTTGSETSTGFRMSYAGAKTLYMGRLVGEMGSDIDLISVANSEFGGMISGSNSNGSTCIGGVIGRISHDTDEARTWGFNTVTLNGSVSNTSAKDTQKIGGLIAEIDGDYNNNSYHRTLTLNGVAADGLKVSGSINGSGTSGGLLGYSWLKTDVDMTDVTVKNTATVDIGAVAGNAAGIVYRATGHWTVTKLDVQSLKMTATNAASVGAIVNKGYFYSGTGTTFYTANNRSALYLELPSSYAYNLVFSGESIKSTAVFDELCAYTCPDEAYIMKNGNGVISVHSGLYTDGSTASDSYHAQTSYGAKPNPNTRYYYNLDTVTAGSSSSSIFSYNATTNANAYKNQLMSWGVNTYACKNLKQYFADPFNGTIADQEYDMSGYSWYPIDLDDDITVNGTFKFYNKGFEDSEKAKYTAENTANSTTAYKRTSLYDSTNSSNTQHYLMHNGLFHDVYSCTMTVGHVIFSGDIAGYAVAAENTSAYNASVCGALVCGTVSGSSSSKVGTIRMSSTVDNAGITLAGIKVYNVEAAHDYALKVSVYAPLLINKLGSHSALNLSNVSTTTDYNYDSNSDNTNDSSYISATSLIGDAGSSVATDVNIEFKLMTLDGRNSTGAADADLKDTAKGNFLAMYNTYNSIFSKATLLNSFSFDSGSSGRYDFTWKQDWDTDGTEGADSSHNGNVTYGKELGYDKTKYPKTGTGGVIVYNSQYPEEEFIYSKGPSNQFTNPLKSDDTGHEYADGFLNNFLPYVANRYDSSANKYQLQVNHGAVATTGCGTYNHPYVIATGNDIEKYSTWMISDDVKEASLRVPTDGMVYDTTDHSVITEIKGTWCADHTTDVLCSYDSELGAFRFAGYTTINYNDFVNPSTQGWYIRSGDSAPYTYTPSAETVADSAKTYYSVSVTPNDVCGLINPSTSPFYELSDGNYTLSEDTTVDSTKKYYSISSVTDTSGNPKTKKWLEESDGTYVVSSDTSMQSGKIYYTAAEVKETDTINPNTKGWYVLSNSAYTPSSDTKASFTKTYYTLTATSVTVSSNVNPASSGLYEFNIIYTLSEDETVDGEKTYYLKSGGTYTAVTPAGTENPSTGSWYERSEIYSVSSDTTVNTSKTYYAVYTFSEDVLRTYLAGAYYKIDDSATPTDLIIDDEGFKGLGASDSPQYRFRGVFDGNQKTITNQTTAPFIYYSNGCVVKDLTINVQPSTDIELVGYQATFDNMWTSKNLNSETATGNAAYGGVISRVIGGDTIIDNVSVNYSAMTNKFSLPAKFAQYVPLGGYIGVVLNGGVIFRNMSDAADAYDDAGLKNSIISGKPQTEYKVDGTTYVSAVSKTDNIFNYDTTISNYLENMAWLYINPYIGRVINGFAVNETSAYHPYETGTRAFGSGDSDTATAVMMQNGAKHYSITDITKSDSITIDGSAVTINSGQDWFLMSLIINSGMDKMVLGYNQAYQVSRSANYTAVGTTENTSTNCVDYDTLAKNDILAASTHISPEFGYLAKTYNSTKSGGVFAANTNLEITLSNDIILPDGYKGIGNLFTSGDNYRIKTKTLDGGGHTISQNTTYYYYDASNAAYYPPSLGIGLINYAGDTGTYQNLKLTGNVKTDLISSVDGSYISSKTAFQLESNMYLCAGMLIGTTANSPTILNMALTDVDVFGLRNTGGLIGFETSGTLSYTIEKTADYDSDKIKVTGRGSTGGMLGKINPGYVQVDLNGHTYSLTAIVCECKNRGTGTGSEYYNYGVGGFIGMMRAGYETYSSLSVDANYFKNIVIGSDDYSQIVSCTDADIFTGGVIGIMNKCRGITIENCNFYNLSVDSKFAAAGLVAFPTTATPTLVKNTHLYSTLDSTITSAGDFAGGLIGSSDPREGVGHGSNEFTFDNCSVSGYTIAGKLGAGGVIGFRGASGSLALNIKNTKVSDCTISSDGYAGGLIGIMNNSVTGYNILVSDIDFGTYTVAEESNDENTEEEEEEQETITVCAGYICGSINTSSENLTYTTDTAGRTGTTPTIKFAGFSRQMADTDDMLATLVGANNAGGNYGTGGYVVFADYNDNATNNPNADFSTIMNSSCVNVGSEVAYRSKTTVTNFDIIAKLDVSGNVISVEDVSSESSSSYGEPVETESTISVGYQIWYGSTPETDVTKLTQVSDLADLIGDEANTGFYIRTPQARNSSYTNCLLTSTFYNYNATNGGYLNQNKTPNSTTGAAIWFFEKNSSNNKYKIYTLDGGTKKYISVTSKYLIKLEESGTEFDIVTSADATYTTDPPANCYEIIANVNNATRYLYYTNANGNAFWFSNEHKQSDANKWNALFQFYKVKYNTTWNCRDYSSASSSSLSYNNGTVTATGTAGSPDISSDTSKQSEYTDAMVAYTEKTGNATDSTYALIKITETVIENDYKTVNAPPYVTTSPKLNISGTQLLTGDGIAYASSITYANSAIGTILSDTSNKKYTNTALSAAAKTNLVSKLDTLGKYGSYLRQMGSQASSTTDFPVLVIDDATDSTNTLINDYLRYLTNTDYDFAAGNSSVFNVQLGGCVWNGSSFDYYPNGYRSSTNPNGSNLFIVNSKFTIDNGTDTIRYDNEIGNRFSLIDVQFYDPSSVTYDAETNELNSAGLKVAYHLYVPVLVKKMLYYDFHASFLSGTNYRVAPYEAKRGNTLIDNIGNPVTLEVQWIYDYDLAGWQAALEAGDDFYRTSFDKRLKTVDHTSAGIPEGTKMVLIDANRNNAHYYANQGTEGLWTESGSFYNFDFSAFGFSDPTLNEYFDVSVTAADENTTVRFEETDEEHAIISKVESGGTKYYRIAENGTLAISLSYKDTITTIGDSSETSKDGKIQDDYYITFFTNSTQATQDLYHLEFSDWGTFDNDTYPTLASDNDHTHILTGDIFVNNNFTISNLNSKTKMSLDSGVEYNDTIQATYTVDVGVNEDIKSTIQSYFGLSSVEVYQSFLIMLNRQKLTSSLQGIATRPDLIAVSDFTISHNETYSETDAETEEVVTRERTIIDYTIDTNPNTDAGMTDPNSLTTANYIELRGNKDLRSYMRTACGTTGLTYSISATWELSYTDSIKMAAQFPTRDSSNINNTSIGTLIGGSSNMSSTPESAVYSKNVAKRWDSDYSYYCTINTNAVLTLNSDDADNENGEFYQLGINANDIDEDDLTEDGYVPMKLNAVYDVSDLSAADTVESMKLTFTVSKKPSYGTALPFADYVNGLQLYSYDEGDEETEASYSALASGTGVSIDTSNTAQVVYIVDDPDELFNYDSESKIYQIPITFEAIIGDAFGNSKEYANYMIRLEVDMYSKKSNAEEWDNSHIDGSNDDDHVIYTHAKLLTSVIE